MTFDDGVVGKAVIVSVTGRVDAAGALTFEAHCREKLTAHNRTSLVLNLEGVEYRSEERRVGKEGRSGWSP